MKRNKTRILFTAAALMFSSLSLTLMSCNDSAQQQTNPALNLSLDKTEIYVGETAKVSVTSSGEAVTGCTFVVEGEDAKVISVSNDGTVTGLAPGTATLTARKANYSAGTWTITVKAVPVIEPDAILEFEKEARTPDPDSISSRERLNTEVYRGSLEKISQAEKVLNANDISEPLFSFILKDFPLDQKVEMETASRIMDAAMIKNDISNKFQVLLGPTGSGKTTTCAKLAINYKSAGKSVFIISLDSYRVGSFYQIQKLTDALQIPLRTVSDEALFASALKEAQDHDVVLIDTMGIGRNDDELNLKLKGMLNLLNRANSEFTFVSSATTKISDLESLYSVYSSYMKMDSMIASKVDECSTIGTLLSFSFKHKLPFSYITNGQRVPEDIEKAESISILRYLNSLDLDLNRFEHQVL